jgi:tripartite-type tricarboxylate transporter receptor subunit TctC
MRVLLSLLALLATAALPASQAQALDYPTRTVRVIIPYTPGGAPDVLLRVVTQALAEKWGQGVVVENRAGGNTLIATVAAAKAEPDGYTLLCAADQTFVLNPLLYASLPYSMKELDPIILMASIPHMLAVANKVPVSNVKELIVLAKSKPDTLMYGTTGPGSIQRIVTEYFAQIAGVKLVHVAYRGAPETMTAVLAGEIDMTINGVSNVAPHIGGGKLKALAISTPERSSLAPNIPTMQEAGVPGYSSQGAFGLFGPAGMPAEIREKIRADVAEVLSRPQVMKALEARSFVVEKRGPAEFSKFIADELAKWGPVIRNASIKGD